LYREKKAIPGFQFPTSYFLALELTTIIHEICLAIAETTVFIPVRKKRPPRRGSNGPTHKKAGKIALYPWRGAEHQSDFRMTPGLCHFVDHSSKKKTIMKQMLVFALALLSVAPLKSQTQYSFAVTKSGKGSPLIFIPGLECSGDVWKAAVTHFSANHTCYVLTLPGFAGQPPVADKKDVLGAVTTQLSDYIRENHLEKPVIVGHSLGGWVALAFGIAHPEMAGGLVIVSSAPFLPALSMGSGITIDSAARIGQLIRNAMSGQSPDQVRSSQKMYLHTMIRDSARIEEVTAMAARSDQPTQGEVMYELFSRDLRPAMGQIRCPILALADWSAYKRYGVTAESVRTNLTDQYRNLSPENGARLTIAVNDNSKHFIMYDEPEWFYAQVDSWLN
jgi:pimeloyl-ACP methyl ester carboxylesterase